MCQLFQISRWSDVGIVPCSDPGIWKVLSPCTLALGISGLWICQAVCPLQTGVFACRAARLSPCHFPASKQRFPNAASPPLGVPLSQLSGLPPTMANMEQNKKTSERVAGSKGKACFSEKFCFILVCIVSKISWVGLKAVKAALCGMENLRGRHPEALSVCSMLHAHVS